MAGNLEISDFNKSLKTYLVGDATAMFIFLGNFEVEKFWRDGDAVGVPNMSIGVSDEITNRMEEMGVFLAAAEDVVVLKGQIDTGYYRYIQSLGTVLPQTIYVRHNNPRLNITQSILECDETLANLKRLASQRGRVFLLPYAVSEWEERLSEKVGIPLAVPSSHIFKKVNSKIYSRHLNDTLGIRQIAGYSCRTIQDMQQAYAQLKPYLDRGEKIVMKDAMGVSGKGIVLIDSAKKFHQYFQLIERKARIKRNQINLVLEKWVDKRCDLNYQFLIGRDGAFQFHFVKEAITKDSVHQGHLIPSSLSERQINEVVETAWKLAGQLYCDGYYGIVGVDAILDRDDQLWPNLEINARFNMSTYQVNIQNRWIDGSRFALAKSYNLSLRKFTDFHMVSQRLGPLAFDKYVGEGFFINCFATLNAGFKKEGDTFSGRIYGICIYRDRHSLMEKEDEIRKAIMKVEETYHEQKRV